MSFSKLAAVAVVGTVLAVATGCGSSKGATTTSTATDTTPAVATTPANLATGAPLTRTALIVQGDKICAAAKEKLSAVSIRTTPQLVRLLPQISIYYNEEAENLAKLVPPRSLVSDWTQFVNYIHLYSEYANKVAQYAKEGQEKTAGKLFERNVRLQEQWIAIAKRDGFKRCSLLR